MFQGYLKGKGSVWQVIQVKLSDTTHTYEVINPNNAANMKGIDAIRKTLEGSVAPEIFCMIFHDRYWAKNQSNLTEGCSSADFIEMPDIEGYQMDKVCRFCDYNMF